ncbi:MAG: RHS repeat-associated core domain-containing protein [Bacteroidales bacterium]|nr:RHS repeat-associated core domain-containing protein [Bacteroidales bacterium]
MNPHPGISPAHCTVLGYRAVVPPGHGGRGRTLPYRALAPNGAYRNTPIFSIQHSTFSIPNWTFTFSAKERDPETGLSYFGSRYYSSDLSIWLSVDPMAHKYASLSPYVYCANNPVKLVDPNGEEIGDYFSMSGRYLGTDGKNDDKIYFVSNMADKRKIRQNDKAGLTTAVSTVNVKITTTKCALWAAEDVYNRTVKNGGFCEEASLVFPDGNIDDFKPGKDVRYTPNDMDAHVNLPKGYERDGTGILIHSHSLGEWELSDGYNHAWPVTSKLDADDLSESQKHAGFIIVGKTTPTDVFGFRRSMAYFFESDTYKGRVSLRAIRRVNKYYE